MDNSGASASPQGGLDSTPGKNRVFTVDPEQQGLRLDVFLGKMTGLSRAKTKKMVQQGLCRLDGTPRAEPDIRLTAGQEIGIFLPETASSLRAEDGNCPSCTGMTIWWC